MTTSGLLASLPGRYARALFELTEEEKCTESVAKALSHFQKTILESAELQTVLKDPTVSREDKARVLAEVCKGLKTPPVLTGFLERLALAQRLASLDKIIDLFQHQIHLLKGEQEIEVFAAHPLTNDQTQHLHKILTAAFSGKLTINFTIDPHLLGGILIRAGSKVIDASAATLLNRLATSMKGTA